MDEFKFLFLKRPWLIINQNNLINKLLLCNTVTKWKISTSNQLSTVWTRKEWRCTLIMTSSTKCLASATSAILSIFLSSKLLEQTWICRKDVIRIRKWTTFNRVKHLSRGGRMSRLLHNKLSDINTTFNKFKPPKMQLLLSLHRGLVTTDPTKNCLNMQISKRSDQTQV